MNTIQAFTEEKRFPVAPDLYGLFFEDISRAGDGGLYPEMLRNRSFEDSLIPEGCRSGDGGRTFVSPTGWVDEFNNGEGMNDWVTANQPAETPCPAWYTDRALLSLNSLDTLNSNRRVSLDVSFSEAGFLYNTGYAGVPQEKGKSYKFLCFAKAERPVRLLLSVEDDVVCSSAELVIDSADWKRYEVTLKSSETTGSARFVMLAPEGGELRLGFTSLMPEDTFMGHGLRRDLVEKLRDMHPGFMRFPGGCIVEGFSMETAMFFEKTVGPVWERPSFWLLWHYRSTNGLGFHEYLQLCEDIGVQPMYVCNCGMTCQGRCPHYFDETEQAAMEGDIMNALEYALGDQSTKWGALRARMGHPAPFRLKYLEIGNENSGPEYAERYLRIREKVLAKYPELLILCNTRDEQLKADIVDDHYYNMPEFYAENLHLYDSYDRSKPDVFVGEFSVNQSYEGQLRGAVAEAMFMTGFERNQDKVKLCSYAPLFEHVNYSSWYPNLIIFDNYRSYGIPSYYAFKLFSRHRGDNVVAMTESVLRVFRDFHGLPMVFGAEGSAFRKLLLNGQPAERFRDLHGTGEQTENGFVLKKGRPSGKLPGFLADRIGPQAVFGTEALLGLSRGVFEAEIIPVGENEAGIGVLCAPKPLSFYDRNQPVPTDPWSLFNLENIRLSIASGRASVIRGSLRGEVLVPEREITLPEDGIYRVRAEYTETRVRFEINGTDSLEAEIPSYQGLSSVVTDTDSEVIIKIVNFTDEPQEVRILLDCDVESRYFADRFSGDRCDENSLTDPERVHDVQQSLTGASRDFVTELPGMSVNVLILKKIK